MKIEKIKHNHTLTNLLKVGIFAMLMIAPLFASCTQLMYVTFNKNAYQSTQITGTQYYTEYEYQTNKVNSADDLIIGNIYKIDSYRDLTGLRTNKIFNLKRALNTANIAISVQVFNENSYIELVGYATIKVYYNDSNEYTLYSSTFGDACFIYQGYGSEYWQYFLPSDYLGNEILQERPVQALDNAFYYGVEKMTESPLFNWTQNTALYSGIKAMTDNLQVQTNVIAVLVTYWTILTIIYIIIDIVLALFTKLTHLLVRSD